jgi:hypothetical protein
MRSAEIINWIYGNTLEILMGEILPRPPREGNK